MTELQHITTVSGLVFDTWVDGPPDGPLVLLCHGFPESWYSWRHQLPALADAGYRVVAPDMRGYGGTDAPADPCAYSMLHHLGDMVGLLDALAVDEAAIVGHDWGSPVAWTCAQLRPDRFRAVASLAVPFLTLMAHHLSSSDMFTPVNRQRPGRWWRRPKSPSLPKNRLRSSGLSNRWSRPACRGTPSVSRRAWPGPGSSCRRGTTSKPAGPRTGDISLP